jgi:DNA helicase HerA-like ATPase
MLNSGTQAFAGGVRQRFDCGRLLETVAADCAQFAGDAGEPAKSRLEAIATTASRVVNSRRSGIYFNDFAVTDLESVRRVIDSLVPTLPDIGNAAPINEDAPLFFDVKLLAEHLERVATEQGGSLAGFISTLGLRIRGMLADHRLGDVIGRDPPASFEKWLEDYVGANGASNGPLAIVDLSLIPSEVVHIVVSVLARVIFEALQRYRRFHRTGLSLPTVLVLEEAHTFVRRGRDDDGPAATPVQLCREAFERIAREGRKFGLGLVLSSQRPSELSPTVLAQCNTFILHRIVNDADQNLVARLVPDNVGGLLRELPSLPSRQAILMAWAAPIPVLVDVEELPENQRPQSADPDFWDVWTLAKKREVEWGAIVRRGLGVPSQGTPGGRCRAAASFGSGVPGSGP